MLINNLYNFNEKIDVKSYLSKHNIIDINEYLHPTGHQTEPFINYDNHKEAFELFMKHINNNSNITLYADIDNDGVTSFAMMYRYIKELNPSINIFLGINNGKIHGISQDVLNSVYSTKSNLLIVPDAGASDYEQHKELKDNGIDVLILEHHESLGYSENAVIISNQLSENVQNKNACGASITYKFITYCEQQFNRKMGWKYLDLCACGLIGDVMSLINIENRTYVYFGLQYITNPFLKILYSELIKNEFVTPKDIAFSLIPKINAIIREDIIENKKQLLKCFSHDLSEEEYLEMIKTCIKAHSNQKKIVEKMFNEILTDIDESDKVIFAFCEKSNYTGLVCGKLCEHYNKPVLLLHKDEKEYRGSARSPIDFKNILETSELMTINSGHSKAWGVGFKIEDLGKLKKWCNDLEITNDTVYNVTASFDASSIPDYLFTEFEDYEDLWGQQIPAPLYHIHNIKINSNNIREMGNGSTIKFSYQGIDYIKFFVSKEVRESQWHIGENKELEVEIIAKFQLNSWRGTNTPQAVIERFEVSEEAEKVLTWEMIF